MKPKRPYTMSPEALEQRKMVAKAGGEASALARKTTIQNKIAEKLDIIVDSMTPEEIADASFKDRATAVGIFYDKLYRDNHAIAQTAIQVNIQTMGMDPKTLEPLRLEIESTKLTGVDDDGRSV